nr:MAG TPA: hypothetical protein [Caudoviricetes sp.]
MSYKRSSYSFASTISTCCSAWAWDHVLPHYCLRFITLA